MLGQPRKLWIWAGASQDLGIACGEGAAAFAFECHSDDCRPAAPGTGVDDLVNEINQVVRKSDGDLSTHTITVAAWD